MTSTPFNLSSSKVHAVLVIYQDAKGVWRSSLRTPHQPVQPIGDTLGLMEQALEAAREKWERERGES